MAVGRDVAMTTLAAGTLTGKSLIAAHSLMFFQAQDSINSGNSKLLMIFIGLAAFALLVQAAAVVGVAVGLLKAKNVALKDLAEIKAKVMPFIDKSHGLVTDLTPQVKEITAKTNALIGDLTPTVKDITVKVQTLVADLSPQIVGITTKVHNIAGHVEEISSMAKDKVAEFGPTISAANDTVKQTNETVRATLMDANDKTRAQVDRVNGMITGVLDSTVKFGKAVEHAVTQPAREVSGMVSGAKTTLEHLAKRYGGAINLGSLASVSDYAKNAFSGLFKKKPAPAARTAPKAEPYVPTQQPTVHTPVDVRVPERMGESTLPAAFGSTVKRDLDL